MINVDLLIFVLMIVINDLLFAFIDEFGQPMRKCF